MKIDKPYSFALAVIGWVNVFIIGWLLILKEIGADNSTWVVFTVFFVISVMSSAVTSGVRKP